MTAIPAYAGVAWGQALPPVDITVVGKDAPISQLRAALGAVERPIRWAESADMELAQVTRPPGAGAPASARVWVDCANTDRVRLYFADWSTERFLLREVPLHDGFTALSLETLAQMIEASLSTLMADRRAGMTRSQMGAALGERPEASVPARAPATIDVSVGAFYAARAFAEDWPIEHGPGVVADVSARRGRVRPGGWATAQLELPETIDTNLAGVHIDTVGFRAGGEVTTPLWGSVTLTLRIGAGGDVLHVVPRAGQAANTTLSAERAYWDTMVEFAALVGAPLGPHLVLSAAVLVDADLVLRHYDVELDGATLRIFTPWRVRPGLMIGLAWH